MNPSSVDELTRTSVPSALKPYHADLTKARHRLVSSVFFGAVGAFCLLYGSVFAFLAPNLILLMTAPLLILGAFVIWALPELHNPPVRSMEFFLFAFFITLIMWPNYLAIALPGLPWITMVRLTGFPLLFLLLVSVSMSAEVRSRFAAILAAVPLVWQALALFVIIQVVSLGLSKNLSNSIDKFIVAQVSWTTVFFVSCFVFAKPGRATFWTTALCALVVLIGLIAIVEVREGHVPWTGHVPSFLQINDPYVASVMKGFMRAYTGRYRAQATFSHSLALGEFMALSFPFVIHIAVTGSRLLLRLGALATVPLIVFITNLSDARSGMLGLAIGGLLYVLAWGVLQWRRNPSSLLGPALVLGYPAIAGAFLVASLFVGRLRRPLWGGGETAGSTDARVTQYHMGFPLIEKAPWGYGIGQAGIVLDYHQPGGLLTIDTYYLTVALDYGVVGFLVYFGMFAIAIYYAAKFGLKPVLKHNEYRILIPIAISLIVFVFIKSVFSQQDNHPFVFMTLGMALALIYRIKAEARAT